jgi:beta-N-acetylhexosaminidase
MLALTEKTSNFKYQFAEFMRKIGKLLLVLIIYTLLSSYISYSSDSKTYISYQRTSIFPEFLVDTSYWADSVLNSLSLEEKIAQLFMLPVWPKKGQEHLDELTALIDKYNPGGVIFFQGGPVRQVQITNYLQNRSKTPLLVAIDGEWGLAMRLDSVKAFPRQMMLGAIEDEELIYKMGARIGEQMNRMGVHVNFAPVIDVNNNALNPVINSRSFGENKELVTRKGMMYMMGLQDNKVLATAKHFPGHGDTDTDSHVSLPLINHSRERLDSLELYPFRQLINSGVGGVMVAHLYVPSLDSSENTPTSLSPLVIDSLLKQELGFKGLVFTDAMNMGGVANHYSPGEADYNAFLAGNDVMLMPRDFKQAIVTIAKGVRKGIISEEEIDKRCKKVLLAKHWAGLNTYEPISEQDLLSDLNKQKDNVLIKQLSDKSITVLRNSEHILPLRNIENQRIATISIGNGKTSHFANRIQLYKEMDHFSISKNDSWEAFSKLMNSLGDYDLVLLSIGNTSMYPSRKYGLTPHTIKFVDSLIQLKPVVVNYLGNPYALDKFDRIKQANAVLVSYYDSKETQESSAEVIFGGIPASGTLPVSIKEFPIGSGIQLKNTIRLSYGYPEEVGMSSQVLNAIDTIVDRAIQEMATPGCQVLVARNGKVVLQKSYGYHTYQKRNKVEDSHLYDLASITKIAATVPLVMHYHQKAEINVNSSLSNYLSGLDTTNKAELSISNILYHQAGLQAWIPFYISTLENIFPSEEFSSNAISEKYPYQIGKRYYLNKHLKYKENYFSNEKKESFEIKIADGLYGNIQISDTIFKRIYQSDLREKAGYKYSDLGFYLLYKTFVGISGVQYEDLVSNLFYSKLGADRLTYLPLHSFDKKEIIPTENDIVFRRQLVHGYVHDPGAAMLGGVSGHAGLFSNANDLAKLMQMYLNGGTYAGHRFFSDSTLTKFTTGYNTPKNRRGLGFDKPELNENYPSPVCESASPSSYGHTGFTGTITWVDPEYNLVYIFLSNRVHPDALNSLLVKMNVRTDIQQTIYNSIVE